MLLIAKQMMLLGLVGLGLAAYRWQMKHVAIAAA
jgi:hypothetical protein